MIEEILSAAAEDAKRTKACRLAADVRRAARVVGGLVAEARPPHDVHDVVLRGLEVGVGAWMVTVRGGGGGGMFHHDLGGIGAPHKNQKKITNKLRAKNYCCNLF